MADREALCAALKPAHYGIDLYNLNFENWTYDGRVAIQAEFSTPLQIIKIHASYLQFKSAEVAIDGAVTKSTTFEHDEKAQVITIHLIKEVPAVKAATITIEFAGVINDDLSGFYRSQYRPVVKPASSVPRDEDGAHYVLSTHMEPNYARRAFPCFDMPNLKATFALSIEVPSDQVALSNMPVKSTSPSERPGWNVVSFETTPVMSTYLVAWAVGDFAYLETATEMEYKNGPIPIRIYTVKGIENESNFALGIAPRAIDLYSKLFDIPCPLEKIDILVVPEMLMTSMENWGLVTSRGSAVLFSEEKSNQINKQNVADNICHELAHQWFGNLVTMQWWDELWLNEGFATWVAHYAVDQIFPDWGIWGTFANGRGEDAFRADGLRGGHPVHIPFEDGTQLHEIFDEISYGKGCAVIRMLVAYVGGETFFKGVSEYLKANLYRNATGDALWKALDAASGKDVGGLAHSWLNIVGYPVVKVEEDVERGDITLTQSRFLTSGDVKPEDDTTVWQLPLGITGVPPGQEDMILKTRHTTISGVAMSLYTVNTNGTGFYRVAYPSARLAKLTTQLHRLSNEDKIAILGSVTALAAAGNGSPTSVLKFLQAFKDETEYAVWVSVVETLQTIGEAFDEDAQIRAGLKQFELRLVEGTVDKLLKEGPPGGEFMKKILWRLMLNRAAVCGHARTVETYSPKFTTWAATGGELDPSMRRIIFLAALAKDSSAAHDTLLAKVATLASGSDAMADALIALTKTDSAAHLANVTALMFSGAIGLQDMERLLFGLATNPIGRAAQWSLVKEYWDTVRSLISDPGLFSQFLGAVLNRFGSETAVADIEEFFEGKSTEAFATTLGSAKEAIRARARYREREAEGLREWLLEGRYI